MLAQYVKSMRMFLYAFSPSIALESPGLTAPRYMLAFLVAYVPRALRSESCTDWIKHLMCELPTVDKTAPSA